jgi:hypothetical protein
MQHGGGIPYGMAAPSLLPRIVTARLVPTVRVDGLTDLAMPSGGCGA